MSYENPRSIIDTQSAQGLQKLQDKIGSTFSSVAKGYKEKQDAISEKLRKNAEENAKLRKLSQKEEDTLTKNVRKTTARYGINQGPSLNVILDTRNELVNDINSGTLPPEQVQFNRERIAFLDSIPSVVQNQYTHMTQSADALSNSRATDGDYGGLDMYGSPDILRDMQTWRGTIKGSRELEIEALPDGVTLETYTVINGNRYSASQMGRIVSGDSELITTIPDPREDFVNLAKASGVTINDKGVKTFDENMFSSTETRIVTDNRGREYQVSYGIPNKAELEKTAAIEAKASIAALSTRERTALWNNKFAKLTKSNKESFYSVEQGDDPKFLEELQEAWVNEYYRTQIGDRIELSRKLIKENKPSASDTKATQLYNDLKTDLSNLQAVSLTNIDRESLTNLAEKIGVAVNQDDVSTAKGETYYNIPIKGQKGFLKVNKKDSTGDVIKILLKAKGYKSSDVEKAFNDFYEGKGPLLDSNFTNTPYFEGGAARFNQ